jgi:REP element-mobilizing transposase RayT
MNYNPEIHKRRSIRLKEYDYSEEGGYFITICTKERSCLFGNVIDCQIQLNNAGKMIETWWQKLSGKYENNQTDEYIIMPNHVHGIIFIVGADQRVCPRYDTNYPRKEGEHIGSPLPKQKISLSGIIQWFKIMSSNEYIRNVKQNDWMPFHKKLWQRNYYACVDEYR